MLDVLTIGDIKMDIFIALPHASVLCGIKPDECKLCLAYGKKIPAVSTHSEVAGTATNVAIGLARMGQRTAVASTMGRDLTHDLAIATLKNEGVETRFIAVKQKKNSSFAAVLNYRGESTQLVVHNAVDIRLPKTLPATQWLHIAELGEGYHTLFTDVMRLAAHKHIRLSVNPGQVQIDERRPELFSLLAASTLLFLNMREARQLVRLPSSANVRAVMTKIRALGAQTVVVTDGQHGAYAYDGTHLHYAPMFPGKRVEATGAGDAFSTGYLGALLHGASAGDALRWGSVNAASAVGHVGPTAGLLTHREILRRLAARPSYKTAIL